MSAMKKTASVSAALALTLALGSGAPAVGQGATSALKGHNTNAPVDVAADRIEVQDRADRAVFSGDVEVTQADMTLNAARLTVAYSNDRGIQIERLDASGGVVLRSPSETARGQFAIYDLNSKVITMLGQVTLTRGASHVNGGRLVLDLNSGRAVMDGGNAPGTSAGADGRVTGSFTVPQRGD